MLTGYLKCKKEWTIRYYLSLAPIIVSFFLISAIHLIYKLIRVDEVKSAGEWLWDFLNFHLADYSWYIGMYIGLFLISPLLNQLWNSLGTRKLHLMAVITMASVTFVPSTVNSLYVPEGMDGTILPTYFTGLWYVTYYLIGCYIRTYRPALKKRIGIPAALLVAAIQGLWNINSRTDPKNYYSGYSASYSNLLICLIAVVLFLMVYRLESGSCGLSRAAELISRVSLEMYLISYIVDSNIYPRAYGKYSMTQYPTVGLLMTLAVFLLAFISGILVHGLTGLIVSGIRRGFSRFFR